MTASPVHDPLSGGGKVGSTATLGDLSGLKSATFDMVDGGPFDADKAYKDSKLCNLLFTAEASRRLAKKNAKATAHAFSPGLIPSPNGFFRYQPKLFAQTFNAIATKAGVAETAAFGGACLSYVATAPLLDQSTNGWWDTDPPGKHQLLCHLPSAEARSIDEQKERGGCPRGWWGWRSKGLSQAYKGGRGLLVYQGREYHRRGPPLLAPAAEFIGDVFIDREGPDHVDEIGGQRPRADRAAAVLGSASASTMASR